MQIRLTQNRKDLEGIKLLQSKNLKDNLSYEQRINDGFVTAIYSIEELELMHELLPSVIAKDQNQIIGYALVIDKQFKGTHDLIDDLIAHIDQHSYNDQSLELESYTIVGQLCVASEYRGQGLASKMYAHFKEHYSNKYTYCVTDVDCSNIRSLQAHYKTGFISIGKLDYNQAPFEIVLWDWNKV